MNKKYTKIAAILTISFIVLFVSGCSGLKNSLSKLVGGMTSGDYKITVWSGGVAVKEYEVEDSFVNSENQSDGWFFYIDGKLVRVSGTITVEEI